MTKYQYPPPQVVPVQTNATTASPTLVKAITLDPTYEAKTAQVVLTRENGVLNMGVYRASTSPDALGMFSRKELRAHAAGPKAAGQGEREVPAARDPRRRETQGGRERRCVHDDRDVRGGGAATPRRLRGNAPRLDFFSRVPARTLARRDSDA